MKKKTLIASAAIAAAGVAAFFVGKKLINRSRAEEGEPSSGRRRHTTDKFSRAKQHVQGSPETP
jgi:hypothetical protein